MFLAVTDDEQFQQSRPVFFANSQNTFITCGSFIVNNSGQLHILPSNTGGVCINIRVTPRPNSSPIFTGRQDVLDKLEKIFTHQVASRLMLRHSCLLWGMGGIGKTQICLKFIEVMADK